MRTASFYIPDLHGYSIKFSPLVPDLLALATCENYGIAGKGFLFVLQQSYENGLHFETKFPWSDGLFDVTWSELDENLLATCSGDGAVQVWNLLEPEYPVGILVGHSKEVYSVDWSPGAGEQLLLSASWDESIKLWDPLTGVELNTYFGHSHNVYGAVWSPHLPGVFSSVSADSTLRLWDIRAPELPTDIIQAHDAEILTCSWSKLDPNILATGGTDSMISGWDIRQTSSPIFQLIGHEYAVRRLKFSPFQEHVLTSVSYDFTTRVWAWNTSEVLQIYNEHTEFVYGVDFSIHTPGKICDCAWDSNVFIYEGSEL